MEGELTRSTYVSGPFSPDGIYPMSFYYGKTFNVCEARPNESQKILLYWTKLEIVDYLARIDVSEDRLNLPPYTFIFSLGEPLNFYLGVYEFKMGGMLVTTNHLGNQSCFPFPLVEEEMQYMSLNNLIEWENDMRRVKIGSIQINRRTQQVFFQFPRPWLEWPRNVLSQIPPNTSPQEVMRIIKDLGYDVVFS